MDEKTLSTHRRPSAQQLVPGCDVLCWASVDSQRLNKYGTHKVRGDAARSPHLDNLLDLDSLVDLDYLLDLDNLLDLDSRVDVHSVCHTDTLAVDRANGRTLAQSGPPAGARGAGRGGIG